MLIKAYIIDKGNKEEYFFKGDYALENFIYKLVEKYFGNEIKIKIENVLKLRNEINGG